jgi:hypothetical protein
LANLVCDVSPENIKKLTSAAAKIGLENGLQQVLETKMREMHRHGPKTHVDALPVPPRPPKAERSDDRR